MVSWLPLREKALHSSQSGSSVFPGTLVSQVTWEMLDLDWHLAGAQSVPDPFCLAVAVPLST